VGDNVKFEERNAKQMPGERMSSALCFVIRISADTIGGFLNSRARLGA
jgi:hypothetical protein